MKIISADERLSEKRGIKGTIFGPAGIGKTSLLWTLNPDTTLFVDLEAGDLAIEGLKVDSFRPRTWEEFRDFTVYLAGPSPALRDDQPFSTAHFEHVCKQFGDRSVLDKYETYFIDSISVLGRLCFQWAKGQPEAFSDRTGKPDNRGAYGLHGREMIAALTHLQHVRAKNVWFVGILDKRVDDFNRTQWTPQIEGSKTGLELPGITDEVLTLNQLHNDEGQTYRAFVCQAVNPWGYPAKDRSGRLDMIEEPHLGKLMDKIRGPAKPAPERLDHHIPASPTPSTTPDDDTQGAAE